jgi:hypothetical protein
MTTTQKILEPLTVAVEPAGTQIALPALPRAGYVSYVFDAGRAEDMLLTHAAGDTAGLVISSGSFPFVSGPWRVANAPTFLSSAVSTSTTLRVVFGTSKEAVLHQAVGVSEGGGGGGGGGGAVTIANGADVALGATTDAEVASGNGSLIALSKNVRTRLADLQSLSAALFGGVGAAADAEAASGNGSLVALVKNVRSRLAGVLDVRLSDTSAAVKIVNDPADPHVVASNVRESFREGFSSLPLDPARWVVDLTGDVVALEGGNSAGASYVSIVHSALTPSLADIYTVNDFKIPVRCAELVSTANRHLGHELVLALAGCDDLGVLDLDPSPIPRTISGNITVASNVWTVNTTTPHGLIPGDRVVLYGCADSRLNFGPVQIATTPTSSQLTFTSTLANGTYTATGGSVVFAPADGRATKSVGWLIDGVTATNVRFFTRDGADRPFISADATSGVTNWSTAVIPTFGVNFNTAFADALQPAAILDKILTSSECHWMVTPVDSATPATLLKKTQALPGKDQRFKLRATTRTFDNMSRPVGRISTIAKTGTTTATVTFDAPHGLTTSDFVVLMGVRDQTNFPNLITATAVTGVPSATQITIVIGSASTTSSFGGFVARINGGQIPALFTVGSVQTIQANADGNLIVVGSGTWGAAAQLGEIVTLYGLRDGATSYAAYEGMYKLVNNVTTTLILKPMTGQDITPLVSALPVGGSLIKNQDVRFHGARVQDYERQVVDVYGAVNKQDNASAISVAITSSAANSVNIVSPSGGHQVAGGLAADAVASGSNPVRIGAIARTTDQSVVSASNDVQSNVCDMTGYLLTTKQIPTLCFAASSADINSTTPVVVLAAPGSGIRTVVKAVQVANIAATACVVELLDNTVVISTISVPANSTVTFDMSEHVMVQNTALQARLRTGSTGTVVVSASVYRRTI